MSVAAKLDKDQCRAARTWLGWTQADLAYACGMGISTIAHFECGKSRPKGASLIVIRQCLERSGRVVFDGENLILVAMSAGEPPYSD